MGLLSQGTPLPWDETKKWAEHIKRHGIIQFINQFRKVKDRSNDTLKWGDEIEYCLVYLDHEKKAARLLLNAKEMLQVLQIEENENPGKNQTAWRMEYAEYMVEGTPGQPFGGCMRAFNAVEANMRLRREEIHSLLKGNQTMICFTTFPRIGTPGFTHPIYPASPEHNKVTRSLFYPDEAIHYSHPRFHNLSRNIRKRRGRKQIINVPVYKDANTPNPFMSELPNDDGEGAVAAKPDHIYLDCMGFGMGCCCLQVTFQACNIDEARVLYDQLAVLAPIMMALSAASPAFRGYLADWDCRWNIISGAVDDRTREELGEVPLKNDKFVVPKSRYDCIDMYISPHGERYNDQAILYDEGHLKLLLDAGIDRQLAEHIAHLFIRDPISVFKEKLDQDDKNDTDHFEMCSAQLLNYGPTSKWDSRIQKIVLQCSGVNKNIQSTNWQSIRFKPPPPSSTIGWRVEFRSMESQLTDFENSAYVVFIVLLTRVILSFDLNLLIPISKVEENMRRAVKRDAVHKEKFYFRKNLIRCEEGHTCDKIEDEYELMDINTIINGQEAEFPGLIPLMESYMDSVDVDIDTRCTVSQYLSLIAGRASGELLTMATWMRKFIRSHPLYKFDSIVSEEIMYDLACEADKISKGEIGCPELFASPQTKTSDIVPEKCKQMEMEMEAIFKKFGQPIMVNGINGNGVSENGISQNGINGENGMYGDEDVNGVNGVHGANRA